MGRGRDRGNRRDRFDDDDQPSYDYGQTYQPQSFGSGPALEATVKWFNATKGFGFVELADGSGDAFLHVAKLQSAGYESVDEGAKLSVQVAPGQKGRQVEAVLSVDTSTAAPARSAPRSGFRAREPQHNRPDPSSAVELEGAVKWYNPDKGFGFVECYDGGKDVFLHVKVLERAGLREIGEGQKVTMKVVTTPKGREAISLTLVR